MSVLLLYRLFERRLEEAEVMYRRGMEVLQAGIEGAKPAAQQVSSYVHALLPYQGYMGAACNHLPLNRCCIPTLTKHTKGLAFTRG